MLLLGVLLLGVSSTSAMFPTECVKNATSLPVICCPDYKGSPCGAAENRGSCMPVTSSRSLPPPDVHIDDKYNFPSFYFSYYCVCKGNYSGANCGGCKPNHYGERCDQMKTLVRKEIRQLTPEERHRYFAQLNLCKYKIDPDYMIMVTADRFRKAAYVFLHASYYDVTCFVHNFITRSVINNTRENNVINAGHGSSAFFTFHRWYIINYESRMQQCTNDPNFAAHYYDWSNDTECEICKNDFLGESNANGQISPFSAFGSWRTICSDYGMSGTLCMMSNCECERPLILRKPGAIPGTRIPNRADVEYCLNLPVYDRDDFSPSASRCFRNCGEGFRDRFENPATSMHNGFHNYCGGTLGIVSIAASDPLFFCHHSYMDKLFEEYIKRRGLTPSSYPTGNNIYWHRANDCIIPYMKCVRNRDMMTPIINWGIIFTSYGWL